MGLESDGIASTSRWLIAITVASLLLVLDGSCVPTDHEPVAPSVPIPSALGPHPATCRGINVSPSDDVWKVVDSAPPGATICISGGTYDLARPIVPKSGQHFIGLEQPVLSGGGATKRAFSNDDGADGVIIRGLAITQFTGHAPEDGAVGAFRGRGWVIENDVIFDNGPGSGVSVTESVGIAIRNDVIAYNGCGGIMGTGAIRPVIVGNTLAHNNTAGYDGATWSCGGGKLVGSRGLTFMHNDSRDNNGYGYWLDGANTGALLSSNRFANNAAGGLLLEINANSGIRVTGNRFSANGADAEGGVVYGAAIRIAASSHIEVSNNVIDATNARGVLVDVTPRSDFPSEDLTVNHVVISHNDIELGQSAAASPGLPGLVGFSSRATSGLVGSSVTFSANRYYVSDPEAPYFVLPPSRGVDSPQPVSWARWRAAGNDLGSTQQPRRMFPPTGQHGETASNR